PDFIDPSHHRLVAGKPSRALDLWLEGKRGVARNYFRGEGSICVAEGVMGMYDGGDTSTAAVAEKLHLPVVLVVDGSAGMESVAATALGFSEYASRAGFETEVKGIIAQKTHKGNHEKGIKEALPGDLEYFGRIPPVDDLEIPERHLGLFMGDQFPVSESGLKKASEFLKVEKLLDVASEPEGSGFAFREEEIDRSISVGLARDEAFNFIYPRTREKLSRVDLVEFSPLEGDDPPDVDGVYLPGGYPELYPGKLESSPTMQGLAERAREGLPVFGECGGMIAMSKGLTTGEGERYEMAGILPAEARMVDGLQGLGYVELEGREANPFFGASNTVRGHEFHYSRMEVEDGAKFGFDVLKGKGIDGEHDGLVKGNSVGTYGHFHPESGLFDDFLESLQD
ncbi:cobyrinate a,c-diamide synthase, partial [Candidatus Bipolaricaulota bacterium]|nr:cobyrinate a,c-diamide synthase [Candidatus Bipolaricaulota bacterium]